MEFLFMLIASLGGGLIGAVLGANFAFAMVGFVLLAGVGAAVAGDPNMSSGRAVPAALPLPGQHPHRPAGLRHLGRQHPGRRLPAGGRRSRLIGASSDVPAPCGVWRRDASRIGLSTRSLTATRRFDRRCGSPRTGPRMADPVGEETAPPVFLRPGRCTTAGQVPDDREPQPCVPHLQVIGSAPPGSARAQALRGRDHAGARDAPRG